MVIKKFVIGKSYNYNDIEEFANQPKSKEDDSSKFEMNEYGQDYTGRGFIVLEDERENVFSFVSDGYLNGTTYKCIYIG
jgi:hypothetical protein